MIQPADWLKIDVRSGAGRSLKAPLFRAIGARKGFRPRVLDATAGYGVDAWLMAAAGCEVFAVERHPAVFAALQQAHAAARAAEPDIAGRLTLHHGEAIQVIDEVDPVDVVYVDPMFSSDRRAAPKRAMTELARLVGSEDADRDAARVVEAALDRTPRRVVVKRAARAPALALPGGRTVDVEYAGRGFRFDVYLRQNNPVAH